MKKLYAVILCLSGYAFGQLQAPVIAYNEAVYSDQDGIVFNYSSVGASPTFQQAQVIKFSPANFIAVVTAAATPFPVCYTTDGTTPTATTPGTCSNGTTFTYGVTAPVNMAGSATVKAISTGAGQTNSTVTTAVITVGPFYPIPGTYSYSPFLATLTGNLGSNLIYTTDGSTPTASGTCTATHGTAAANGVQVTLPSTATTTVKFIPCVGGTSGAVQTGTYTTTGIANWYILASGGTRQQCNGKFNASYASTGGTGTDQNCAFNDFRYLWTPNDGSGTVGSWVIAGGDTVNISGCTALGSQVNPANPACRLGYDEGNDGNFPNSWCPSIGPYDCHNPTIPSGSSTQPTRFLGINYAACATGGQTNPRNYQSQLAHLFAGFALLYAFDLRDTQNVTIACIELTTHNGGAAGQCTTNVTVGPKGCSKSVPLDDFAENGWYLNRNSANIKFQDVSTHGFNSSGMDGPLGAGIGMTRVYDGFNAFAGWNMDDGFNGPDGTLALINASYVTMEANGCFEEWPIVHTVFPGKSCYDLQFGGFGDAWSGQDTLMDTFICDHCDMHNNTKDADIGPHPIIKTLIRTNSKYYANDGSQWKFITDTNGTATFLNNLVIGNCARMNTILPGAPQTYDNASGLTGAYLVQYCRAGGNSVASSILPGATWLMANNTFVNYDVSNYDMFIGCGIAYFHPAGNCATAHINLTNNIFLGYQLTSSTNGGPALFGAEDGTVVPTFSHNIDFGNKPGSGVPCGTAGNVCSSPLLVSQPIQQSGGWATQTFLDSFNFNITGTPAAGAGATYTGILPADYAGNTQTSPPVIGALTFLSAPSTTGVTASGVKFSGVKF